ncbi:MAG TPA: Gfo/Idh/MocA family oxidoreductase, partial [Bacteroidales bacterium]|nr:Gfo/Idh/MocA family oxidoreductase [Bacteroidales bacterium]HPM87883.1 Gfo/Idh/MocA family oxidoreductase [Bacteroidales bacterium]
MSRMTSKKTGRREFLTTSAAAFAGITVLPGHVISGFGHVPPSDKLNIACVGIGGMGRSNLSNIKNDNIVALCDVDWREASTRVFKLYPAAKQYKDYRVMLDKQKDIEAVIVATSDHTHAVISMEAMKRKKHVFTQKPLTHTVYEARALAKAAREYKVATQMGNQGQASDGPRRLR